MRMKKIAVMALAATLSVGSVMTASAAWLQEGNNWKYQNDNGTFQAGTWFQDVDGRWYHFDNNGIMQKGWFQDTDGKWYFFAYNGVMQVGLLKIDNQVYYMNPSGDLFLGDMVINGTTYNFGLYGTTNGQPSVPATATYGRTGSQSLSKGSSSGRSTSSSKSKLRTVSTVEDLNNLAKDGYTNLKYATNDGGEATFQPVADVDYTKVTLTVDAPNQTIINEIGFKQVTIEAVKPNTWTEYAGNKIFLKSDTRIVNESSATVINVATSGLQVKLEGAKTTGLNITAEGVTVVADVPIVATVSKNTVLVVNEASGSSVNITAPVTVEVKSSDPTGSSGLSITTTESAKIETAIPANITASKQIQLVITHSAAATDVTVKAADSSADGAVANTVVTNESSTPVTVAVKNSDDSLASTKEAQAAQTTTEESVKKGIASAVDSANSSSYINASISGNQVTVSILRSGASLVEVLPTARTIINMFKSVEGVNDIWVGNTQITNDSDMIDAARALGFNGTTKLEDVNGTYTVEVWYNGGGQPLSYNVSIQ